MLTRRSPESSSVSRLLLALGRLLSFLSRLFAVFLPFSLQFSLLHNIQSTRTLGDGHIVQGNGSNNLAVQRFINSIIVLFVYRETNCKDTFCASGFERWVQTEACFSKLASLKRKTKYTVVIGIPGGKEVERPPYICLFVLVSVQLSFDANNVNVYRAGAKCLLRRP